jgi:hypothetical protein
LLPVALETSCAAAQLSLLEGWHKITVQERGDIFFFLFSFFPPHRVIDD